MKSITTILGATVLSTAALAQQTAPALAAGSRAPAPAVLKPMTAKPAMWVVKDADTTIYLLGTIHLLRPGVTWLDGGVKRAYDASSEVYLEVIQPEPAAMQASIMKLAVDPDGPALTQKLGPETAAIYRRTLAEYKIPEAAFEKLEPWFVSTVLSVMAIQKAGLDPESGVERQLTSAVKRDGKTLAALETVEQQLGYFDGLPEPVQIAFMKATLEQLPRGAAMLDTMIGHWAKGNPDGLAQMMNEAMVATPEIAKALLTDRNARWAEWIDTRLDTPGTVFVAVGAGHLAGKGSVQDYLKARKLKAVRVKA